MWRSLPLVFGLLAIVMAGEYYTPLTASCISTSKQGASFRSCTWVLTFYTNSSRSSISIDPSYLSTTPLSSVLTSTVIQFVPAQPHLLLLLACPSLSSCFCNPFSQLLPDGNIYICPHFLTFLSSVSMHTILSQQRLSMLLIRQLRLFISSKLMHTFVLATLPFQLPVLQLLL